MVFLTYLAKNACATSKEDSDDMTNLEEQICVERCYSFVIRNCRTIHEIIIFEILLSLIKLTKKLSLRTLFLAALLYFQYN